MLTKLDEINLINASNASGDLLNKNFVCSGKEFKRTHMSYPIWKLLSVRRLDHSHKCVLDLSRFCAVPSARLRYLSVESDRVFPVPC